MKKILTFIIIMAAATTIIAQGPPASGKPGMAVTGRIFGKLTNNDGKSVGDATVLLMENKLDTATKKVKQVLFRSLVTTSNGNFNFDDVLLRGKYTLKVSCTGFKPYDKATGFMDGIASTGGMPSTDKDLGNIKLTADVKELQSVTVTSSAASIRLNAEKKIFNVEKNIMSAGGTGVDVMRNVPSVNVDIDGNVTMRNSAPQILVDGRPTTLTLDQIPADAIESVEVISNPSAKYDASGGGAGVLNIVLKKNRKSGYNGNARVGIDKRGAVNGGFDFNVRQNKINFSAALFANQNRDRTTGTTQRISKLTDPITIISQDNMNRMKGGFVFGKVGVDYFATSWTTISLSTVKVHGEFSPNETIYINTDSLYTGGKVNSISQRLTMGSRVFNGQGLVFGMKHTFPKAGEEWTIDANYFGGKGNNHSLYTTNYLTNTGAIADIGLQTARGSGKDKNFVIQTDYTLPVNKTTKLEAGVRAAIRNRMSVNNNYLFNDSANNYVIIPTATSNYENTDKVYAGYATLSSSIKEFSYKVGLRTESSSYNGKLANTGETFKNSYPVSLFPSVFLSEKLANKQEVQLSYSRRINRPNFFQLIPFTDYTDKLNITRGNPNLLPEFTQSLELSYLKTFKGNNTLLASVYYKHTDNLITRYLSRKADPVTNSTTLINSYINANSSYSRGAELTLVNNITKWWDVSTNLNAYNSKVNTSNITSFSQDAIWSLFGKFNSNFKLPANYAIQLTSTYQSKTNLPVNSGGGTFGPPMMQSQSSSQGYIKPSWGVDIAVKKSFLKNNAAAISISVSDIFKTRINSQYSSSDYFVQNYSRLRDPQMVKLNFSYRFGKVDASLFKLKSNKGDSNVTENVQQ